MGQCTTTEHTGQASTFASKCWDIEVVTLNISVQSPFCITLDKSPMEKYGGRKLAMHLGLLQIPSGYAISLVKVPLISLCLSNVCLSILKASLWLDLVRSHQKGKWLPTSAHPEGTLNSWKLLLYICTHSQFSDDFYRYRHRYKLYIYFFNLSRLF